MQTTQYIRKPFQIDAVTVTPENIQDVATWVGGEVRSDDLGQYVKVRVHRPLNDRQTKAYAGDHVLYAGTGYKVYTDKAFKNSFILAAGTTITIVDGKIVEDKRSEIVGSIEGDVVVPKRVVKKATAKSA